MMNSDDVLRGSIAFGAALLLLVVGIEVFREARDHQEALDAVTISRQGVSTNLVPVARTWPNRTGPGSFSGPQTGPPISTDPEPIIP